MQQVASRRWWLLEGDDCANQVVGICDTLEREDIGRRERYRVALSLYEGRNVSLDSDRYFDDMPGDRPLYNLTRSACDTAQADIAGRQKPKPLFMTTGADWKARRRALKLDKFVEAQLHEKQGCYADAWQLMLDCFHDSAKLGNGIAKVWGDGEHKKVRIERVFPWELHVDQREARYGDPQNLFHVYDMEKDIAIELFCNVEDDEEGNQRRQIAIENAKSSRPDSMRVADCVRIREAWRLPFSEEKPGKHVIAVDNAILVEEEWTRAEFPFVILIWNRDTVGYWGTGLAEEGAEQQLQINDTAYRISERIKICSTKRTYYNPDAIKGQLLEVGGEGEILIPLKDMSQCPQEVPPNPVSPAEVGWLDENIARYYENRGISQMSAQAVKPSGVTAAVAMQTLNDIATVRFLPKARGYETAFITLGRLCVQAARDIAKDSGGLLVKWPGKKFIKEFDWNEVSLEDDMYSIRVASVSQYSRDPSAILEMAQELFSQGLIQKETFLEMIGLPDLQMMLDEQTAERQFLEELMDRYLDSMDDDELAENGGYEAPEPFLTNKQSALVFCVASYWEAKRDGAPEYCLALIRQYIQQLDKLMAPPAPAVNPAQPLQGPNPVPIQAPTAVPQAA